MWQAALALDHQDGISPQPHSKTYLPSGPGRVGAVEGQVDEEDSADLVASGAFEEDAEGMQEEISESRDVEGPREDDKEEGQDPRRKKSTRETQPGRRCKAQYHTYPAADVVQGVCRGGYAGRSAQEVKD